MLLFDAHLDLSMNAVEWNRDYTRSLDEVRYREQGMTDKLDRAKGVITFEEMRRGSIGLCVATQIARYVSLDNPLPGWHSPEIAWSITQGQLAWYREMERIGQLVQIVDRDGLNRHVELWQNDPPADAPIGYILSLEGADSICSPAHLERAYEYGLRALGPAHYGEGRYSPGTGSEGGLTPLGRDLLKQMRELGIVLDATHLTDEAFWESLELWDGPVWASHNNCRALVPAQRQFSDEQLKALIERDAVVGMAFDAWMMHPDWVRGTTTPQETGLKIERIALHIDHICQLAGNVRHVGIGSDLDGGFGTEQAPMDLESIADLQSLTTILADRGYSQADVEAIMHGNWIRRLNEIWS
ncbi:MAG: membrane dipeptidase [Planctomycetaceae bacterium]|nr:dipeptidase [Planctomycetales bacterium]MCB9923436.1 membrane dipeptidase [Planctomycetaceae bacterium]